MKALTILQPYAAMIALPDDNELAKRVENRTWATDYLGVLAIHAGMSRKLIEPDATKSDLDVCGIPIAEMAFGAVVATARLAGCYALNNPVSWRSALRLSPWLATHPHVEGPICWVLREVHTLSTPIKYKGTQGLWTVPPEIAEQLKQDRDKAGY